MEKLPRIAFGTWAWGNDGTFGPALDEEALRPVFDAAMQEGTVLWDTAYVYGMGESEKLLGRFLRHVQPLIGAKRDPELLSFAGHPVLFLHGA